MANSAIRLRAMLDFESESGEKRVAGDEWLFEGPGTVLSYDFGIKLFLSGAGRGLSELKLISSPYCAVAGFAFIFVLNSLLMSHFGNYSIHEVF